MSKWIGLVVFTLISPNFSVAETLTLDCLPDPRYTCLGRIIGALEFLGCEPDPLSAVCIEAKTKSWNGRSSAKMRGPLVCEIESKCSKPEISKFGLATCKDGKSKIDLMRVDRGLGFSIKIGLLPKMVRQVCLQTQAAVDKN